MTLSVGAPVAYAVTITVNTTDDELNSDGDCSLREAIQATNTDTAVDACPAGSGADTITFGVTGTITLASGQLTVTSDLTIDGPGAANLTISGNNASRVLEVIGGVTLDLAGVTVANGSEFQGGGIFNSGTLILTGATISNNVGELSGGGIWNTGTAMLTDSTVSGNTAPGPPNTVGVGGGIWNSGGTVILADSSLSGNSAGQAGGFANTGTLTVTGSTIDGNTASSSSGGGDNYSGTVTITNATVSGNSGWAAGGLRSFGGTVTVASSTFSDNTGIGFTGFATGAIKNEPGYGGVVNVGGSILANSPTFGDCLGTITSQGYNLIEDTSSCTIEGDTTGNLTGVDPVLGPLGANGGPTKTHALLEGSPAIDAGSPACPPPATDQRGVSRPQGAACDIGAFELVQNQSPNCASVVASPNRLWPPNHTLRLITLSGATDPDGDTVTLTITGVTQDEPVSGLGPKDVSPDAQAGTQSNTVFVRAERSDTGDGRVYRISFTGDDGKGGSCAGTTTVGVPKSRLSTPVDSAPPSYNSFGP